MQIEKNHPSAKHNSSKSVLNGVVLLTASTLICKIIGLFFKIPIIGIVGIDGMAYFTNAYNVYMFLNAISAAGLPVALSIMVAKNRALNNEYNLKKVFNVALTMFLILGITGTLLLFFGADIYSESIGMPETALCVRAISPTILFICISGAIRGYFQGHELMTPTAVSQLLESLGKLVLGIGFALIAVNCGCSSDQTAAFAIFGLSVGVFISMLFLIVRYRLFKRKRVLAYSERQGICDRKRKIISDLAVIALPITLSASITSITSLADTALITNRLVASGLSPDAAVTLYSSYSNLAIPLFNLPPALVTAISLTLVPTLTAALATKRTVYADSVFKSSMRLCLGLALPAAAGLGVFAKPILLFIYPAESEACNFAAPLLSVLSVSIVFCCVTTVCNAVLQAHLKTHLPIIAMVSGAAVKIVVEYILLGSAAGIYGAPISTIACTFTIMIIDILFVIKHTSHRFEVGRLIRCFCATVLSVSVSLLFFIMMRPIVSIEWISLIASIILAVFLYAVLALLLKVFAYDDFLIIPGGKRLADALRGRGFISE